MDAERFEFSCLVNQIEFSFGTKTHHSLSMLSAVSLRRPLTGRDAFRFQWSVVLDFISVVIFQSLSLIKIHNIHRHSHTHVCSGRRIHV